MAIFQYPQRFLTGCCFDAGADQVHRREHQERAADYGKQSSEVERSRAGEARHLRAVPWFQKHAKHKDRSSLFLNACTSNQAWDDLSQLFEFTCPPLDSLD
jgi:hypothetical protein